MHAFLRVLTILGLLFIILLGIKGLGDGFKMLGRDVLETFFTATSNPFVGLLVGILTTSIIQSSSVTTSMIVGLVAAPENPLPLANAVPMDMGANIGTTVTALLASLAVTGPNAILGIQIAWIHFFFNLSGTILIYPVERTLNIPLAAARWCRIGR
jgi:sodium-dependent phosphate cotransporter